MADELDGRVELAKSSEGLEERSAASLIEEWMRLASDPGLGEDQALHLLKQAGLSGEVLERLNKNKQVMKSRKVRMAVVGHPKTPRHVSVPAIRQLFTFDLMNVALAPLVPEDIKKAAEDALILKMETISFGERLSLARRASGRVAGALLRDGEAHVVEAALDNGRLTEAQVAQAVVRENARAHTVQAVCQHPKWAMRQDVRVALLRSEKTPVERAEEIARGLPRKLLREVLLESRLPGTVKEKLLEAAGS